MAERRFDYLSFLVGLAAVLGAGLYLLDDSGAVQVDELVAVATLWIALGTVGLVRTAQRFVSRRRMSG